MDYTLETPLTTEQKWAQIRLLRNALLRESDHVMLEDYPGSKKAEWKAYRKALRDLPTDFSDPDQVVFPTKPE